MYETTQVTAITVFQLSPKVDEILSELKDACQHNLVCSVDTFPMDAFQRPVRVSSIISSTGSLNL